MVFLRSIRPPRPGTGPIPFRPGVIFHLLRFLLTSARYFGTSFGTFALP